MNILERTFNEMPNTFTSQEFNKMALRNGFQKIKHKGLGNWLKRYAENMYYGSKTWQKKVAIINIGNKNSDLLPIENKAPEMDEQKAIQLLKETGKYKILKISQEWKEI
jgi:hypothetical protein